MLKLSTGSLLAAALVLASCGGGGGNTGGSPLNPGTPDVPTTPSTPTTPTTPTPPVSNPDSLAAVPCATAGSSYNTWMTASPALGKNAAVSVVGCSGPIGAPQWVQTAGPAVALAAERTQTLSFDPPQAGTYSFRLSFTDPAGTQRTETLSMAVPTGAPAATSLTLRASHSVRAGGAVSVRAWPTLPTGDTVAGVSWTQLEGPAVQLDTTSTLRVLFTAPVVGRDTPIRLRATLRSSSGATSSDEVLVLVERSDQMPAGNNNAMWSGDHVQRTHAYKSDSPYAAVLVRCVYDPSLVVTGAAATVCPLSQLPFLTQEAAGGVPTVEQVMSRVVVSHDWLGRNFEAFLRAQDVNGDLRRMLGSVTAIVLGSQVRPSFYNPASGAIYLDADNFWLTPEERDTVNEAPDYRSSFGDGLLFAGLWRYVENNRNIFAYFDPERRITRNLADVRNEATWLMFHELSHALDFTPPSAMAGLLPSQSVWANIAPRYVNYQLASDALAASQPLTSSVMSGLGEVLYEGMAATTLQKTYTATQVGSFFAADRATDDYAYSNPAEDLAMTQEEFLMSRRLGIRRDVGYTDASDAERPVRWGQRGRVGEAAIKPRARAIASALLPWIDPAEVNLLPAPETLAVGTPWRSNGVQQTIPRQAQSLSARAPDLMAMWQAQKQLQRLQLHRQAQARWLPVQRPPLAFKAAAEAPR